MGEGARDAPERLMVLGGDEGSWGRNRGESRVTVESEALLDHAVPVCVYIRGEAAGRGARRRDETRVEGRGGEWN